MGERHWYVVHTYSGYENKVKDSLMRIVDSHNLQDRIFQAVIPMENVIEERKNKRVVVQRKVYPGYVLVDMVVDPETWYVVRNTNGVTGFVGSEKVPVPLTDAEAAELLKLVARNNGEKPDRVEITVKPGDNVKIKEGAFAGNVGEVVEINEAHSTVTVLIDIFGRSTKTELDYFQIEKV